jgi:hypothetical protein
MDRRILDIEQDVRSRASGVMPWIARAIKAHRKHRARHRGRCIIGSSIPHEDDMTRSGHRWASSLLSSNHAARWMEILFAVGSR